MHEDSPILASRIARAVELANDLRARDEKVEQIETLPKGLKRHRTQCVIARAFNFRCEVGQFQSPEDFEGPRNWAVTFGATTPDDKKDMIVQWAKDNKLRIVWDKQIEVLTGVLSEWKNHRSVRVELPSEVGFIAELFDSGGLPDLVQEVPPLKVVEAEPEQ